MYSKCVFVLKQDYSSHLSKEKNCLFCPTCFCTLLDSFSGSVIFFYLENFYNTKLQISTEHFNQIVRNSQPHLLYSPSWVPLWIDLDPLTMSITNKPFFLSEFNTVIRSRNASTSIYHSVNREPPLPVYLATTIHNKTKKLSLIEKMSQLGFCISKHRLSDISIFMGNSVIKVVIPTSLMIGMFSTGSVDNIDIEIKSLLASTSLHGTVASINQHPRDGSLGKLRSVVSRWQWY